MKKMLKKALRPEKSFEDWARINNVELNNNEVQNNNIVQNYKNSQMQKKYLIFRNVMTIVIFLVVLTPMLYVINYNTYSNHLTPGEITIPDPPKPPDPPDPPKPITYSSSAVKPLYLSIDEIFNELNVDRRIILFNEDIQNESEAEAYKETIKPSINKNEPTVSYVINNCEYPCVDRGIFIIDFFFRLDPNYLFDNYLKYSNLMPLEIRDFDEIFYVINENIGYVKIVFDGVEYFMRVCNVENTPGGDEYLEITEEKLQDFFTTRKKA